MYAAKFVYMEALLDNIKMRHINGVLLTYTPSGYRRHINIAEANFSNFSANIAKLSNQNYQTWKFKVELLLTKDDLLSTVEDDRPEEMSDEWRSKDRKARATIGDDWTSTRVQPVTSGKKTHNGQIDIYRDLQRYHLCQRK